ncbi:hypothetical protein M2401_006859 [Pseudomonas sp. JUb42]|nr:hypothetical protein [Pseudomonas sp. JUb42]
MKLSDAYEVVEALSTNEVNSKLQEGWKLLTVVVTARPNGQLHPCYILGKLKEQEQ